MASFGHLANSSGNPSNCAPGVHHSLTSCDSGARLQGAVFEAPHDQRHHHISLLLSHLGGDCQQHQHVVALSHPHGVEVGEDIGTGDLALHVGVLHQRVEEVCRLYEGKAGVPEGGDGRVHANANPRNGHVHEVRRVLLLALIVLQPLEQLEENLLGHLAPSALQIGKPRQAKVGF